MRSRIILLLAALAVCFTCALSCKKNAGEESAKIDISGDWKLSTLNGESVEGYLGTDKDLCVYIVFRSDGSFSTYQQFTDREDRYARHDGIYKVRGYTASGTYSDGSSWKAEYESSLSSDGKTLTMVSGLEVCEYQRTQIPESVTGNSVAGASVRSGEIIPERFL